VSSNAAIEEWNEKEKANEDLEIIRIEKAVKALERQEEKEREREDIELRKVERELTKKEKREEVERKRLEKEQKTKDQKALEALKKKAKQMNREITNFEKAMKKQTKQMATSGTEFVTDTDDTTGKKKKVTANRCYQCLEEFDTADLTPLGCDHCPRWFHTTCLSGDMKILFDNGADPADEDFQCEFCDNEINSSE
jgi:hypothetical protein